MGGKFAFHKLRQCGKPLPFIVKFRAVQGFAVYAVHVYHAHAVDGGGNHAPLRVVGHIGQSDADIGRLVAADDGNTVIGLLACPNGVPAAQAESGGRKIVLFQFDFLQCQHVGAVFGKPCGNLRQAHV